MNNYGVPQGSVLGPLLFNIFVNDVFNLPECESILFADDTVLLVSDPIFEKCIEKVKYVVNFVSKWLQNNRLLPNINKTKLMIISPKQINELPDIYFDHTRLEWVNHIK